MEENSLTISKFCAVCGGGLVQTAVVCPKCGSAVAGVSIQGGKSKSVAVLLAIFLAYWTFLYTYSADKQRFWTSIILAGFGSMSFVALTFLNEWLWVNESSWLDDEYYGLSVIAIGIPWLISAVLWIYSLVTVSKRTNSQYSSM